MCTIILEKAISLMNFGKRVVSFSSVRTRPFFVSKNYPSLISDEEIGGKDGMGAFVKTEKFKELNVGFALDESHASEKEEFVVHYGERCTWCESIFFSRIPEIL